MKIITIIIALLFANNIQAQFRIEAGLSFLSDEYSDGWTVLVADRYGKWDFAMGYIDDQHVLPSWEEERDLADVYVPRNAFVQVQRILSYDGPIWIIPDETGIGIARFQNTNRALGKQNTGAFSLAWNVGGWLWTIRHDSNMGSGTPNMGQDLFTVGYNFGAASD